MLLKLQQLVQIILHPQLLLQPLQMLSTWWRRSTSSQIMQYFNPALGDCNGLKLLVVSSRSVCLRSFRLCVFVAFRGWRVLKWNVPSAKKLQAWLAWCNQPRVNEGEMMAIKQNSAVVSPFLVLFCFFCLVFPLWQSLQRDLKQYAVCSELTTVPP